MPYPSGGSPAPATADLRRGGKTSSSRDGTAPGRSSTEGRAAARGAVVDLEDERRRRRTYDHLQRLSRSSRYAYQPDADDVLDPGLYGWSSEPDSTPAALLTGRLRVIEADASDVDGVASRLMVEVAHPDPDDGRVFTLDVTRDRAVRGLAWEPLFGSGVLFPEQDRDCRRAYAALSDLAAYQAKAGQAVIRRRLPHLGWYALPATAGASAGDGDGPRWTWVAADGTVDAAGIDRPGRLHAGSAVNPPQTLPELGADQQTRALAPERVLQAVTTLFGFFDGACPGLEAGLLGAFARVTMRPVGDERRPGTLNFEGEIVGRSGWHKSTFLNAGFRLFAGAGYDHETETQLVGGDKLKDSAIGSTIRRAELAFHPYADFDHAAHRGAPMWEAQQRHRVESLYLTGDGARGGTVGTRDGGTRERRQPAGFLVRTLEDDPHLFSVPLGQSGADFRGMTFKLAGPSAAGHTARIARSTALFGPLAPTLDAVRLAWLRWQASQPAADWPLLAAVWRDEVNTLMVEHWDEVPAAYGLHDRVRRQLVEVLLGLTAFGWFIEGLDLAAAAVILGARVPLIRARVAATVELTAMHADASGLDQADEYRAGLDALHAAIFGGRAHVVAVDTSKEPHESSGQPDEPAVWGWTDERPQGLRVGWLDERGDVLWLQRNAAFDAIRRQYRATSGVEFPLTDRAFWNGLAKRGLLAAHDLATERQTVPVRRRVNGRQHDVIVLSVDVLTGITPAAAEQDPPPTPPDPAASTSAPSTAGSPPASPFVPIEAAAPAPTPAPTSAPSAPPRAGRPQPARPATPRGREQAPEPGRVGVLDVGGLHLPDGRVLAGFHPPNAGILAGVALEHGLRGVALHDSAVTAFGIEVPTTQGSPVPSRWLHDGLDAYTAVPEGVAPWVTLAERDPRAQRKLWLGFVTDNESLGAFSGLADGPALLRALETFRRHFGLAFYSSPGRTGLLLIRDTIGRGLRPGTSELAPPALDRDIREAPFSWSRVLTDQEQRDRFVIGYDVNGQYLAAMSSLRLSAGAPEHRQAPTFDRHLPGYWLVKLPPRPAARTTAALLPDPFRPVLHSRRAEPADGFAWVTTPTVEFLQELGHRVEIREAWVWPQSRRFLDGYYQRCRDARTALMHAASPEQRAAYRAVKLVYTKTLGMIESSRYNVAGGELYRPEWHHTVIAKARANLVRKLRRLTRAPFAVDVDALYFTSPDPDPQQAAAQIGLPLSGQLGAFKVIGTAPLSALDGVELGTRRAALRVRDAVEGAGESGEGADASAGGER